jgi:hypothetical protein
MFSRFRTASGNGTVVVPAGECCDRGMSGPFLPTAPPAPQPGMIPAQPNPIPRIDENGKQLPWSPDGKVSGRPGIKTNNDGKPIKEGI